MENFTLEEYNYSKIEIEKIIRKCEGILPKFKIGTSQHSLLVNRINALSVCKDLIDKKFTINQILTQDYTVEEIKQSLAPIESIIHKCNKAQSKYEVGTLQYNRYIKMIQSMNICKSLIENELSKYIF